MGEITSHLVSYSEKTYVALLGWAVPNTLITSSENLGDHKELQENVFCVVLERLTFTDGTTEVLRKKVPMACRRQCILSTAPQDTPSHSG